jgi:hypothetical protein
MNDTTIRQIDEEILTREVTDEAMEAAAGMVTHIGGSVTISFCTGLESCPT